MRATKGEHAFLIRSCLSVIYVLRRSVKEKGKLP